MKLVGTCRLYAEIDGNELPILSPWSDATNILSCDQEMHGGWIYLGSYSEDDELFIDFVSLRGFAKIARWRIDNSGKYIDQTQINAARIGLFEPRPHYTHTNSPRNLATLGHANSNDLQIYTAIRYLLRDPAGARTIMNTYNPDLNSAFRPALSASESVNMHIVVVFNHNYARNIPHLDKIYSDRFTSATYVLPNIAPDSKRCFTFPVGSYSYHTLIYHTIDKLIQRDTVEKNAWYLFAHDDVYLNKNFSQTHVGKFFSQSKEFSSLYYKNPLTEGWDFNAQWPWNTRVLNSLEKPKDNKVGNGFEGFDPFFQKDFLARGIGDIFAVRGTYLREFAEILGNYISQNVFPEISIPSTLKILATTTETSVGHLPGEYLWHEDRAKINLEYLKHFDASNRLFLHPVKISLMRQYKNLDEGARRPLTTVTN